MSDIGGVEYGLAAVRSKSPTVKSHCKSSAQSEKSGAKVPLIAQNQSTPDPP